MSSDAGIPNEINVPQLFSDVSRTLNGFKNLFIPSSRISGAEMAAHFDSPSLPHMVTDIFSGNVCFKACGMEDIQLAAQTTLIFDGRSGLSIESTFNGISMSNSRYQKTGPPTQTRESLRN
uniref:Bm4592 n=1 Tax=Brugia malayi TaxID=6279 RepID=A0A7I4KGY7_BRUMA